MVVLRRPLVFNHNPCASVLTLAQRTHFAGPPYLFFCIDLTLVRFLFAFHISRCVRIGDMQLSVQP